MLPPAFATAFAEAPASQEGYGVAGGVSASSICQSHDQFAEFIEIDVAARDDGDDRTLAGFSGQPGRDR